MSTTNRIITTLRPRVFFFRVPGFLSPDEAAVLAVVRVLAAAEVRPAAAVREEDGRAPVREGGFFAGAVRGDVFPFALPEDPVRDGWAGFLPVSRLSFAIMEDQSFLSVGPRTPSG